MSDTRIYFDPPVTLGVTVAASKGATTKVYLEKVASLVPVEIVGAYKAAMLLVPLIKPSDIQLWVSWVLFILGIIGTLFYVGWRIGPGFKMQRHLIVYAVAFIVWAYAMTGEQLLSSPYYQPALAAIILIVSSAILGKVKLPKQPKQPKRKG